MVYDQVCGYCAIEKRGCSSCTAIDVVVGAVGEEQWAEVFHIDDIGSLLLVMMDSGLSIPSELDSEIYCLK